MIALAKICLICASAICGIWFITISQFKFDFQMQTSILISCLIANFIAFGWRPTLSFVWIAVLVPAVLYLVITAVLVNITNFSHSEYWRPVWFVSCILLTRLCFGAIRFRDTISLPISRDMRRDLLVYQILLNNGIRVVRRLIWYADRVTGPNASFYARVRALASTVLAMFIWLVGEGEWVNEIVKNRMPLIIKRKS